MDFRKQYHERLGLSQPQRLEHDGTERHRCSYCNTRQNTTKFCCPACVRKTVSEYKDGLKELDEQRRKKQDEIEKHVQKVKGTFESRKKQRILDTRIKRLEHLREFVKKQRELLAAEQKQFHDKKDEISLRLDALERSQRNSLDNWPNVRSRVPEVTLKISSKLKVRRETLRKHRRGTIGVLDFLYPIRMIDQSFYTIAGIPMPAQLYQNTLTRQSILEMHQHLRTYTGSEKIMLPNPNISDSQQTLDPIFAALGYVVLLCKLLSHYLATPLPFKMRFRGCHSYIEDHDDVRHGLHLPRHRSSMFADEDNQFQHVHRAIKLLDYNILHLCKKFSLDRRRMNTLSILPNLHSLCEWLCSDDQDREIIHPFASAAHSGFIVRNEEDDLDEQVDARMEEEFVIIETDSPSTDI